MSIKSKKIPGKILRRAKKYFGASAIKKIEPAGPVYNKKHKIVVFVPHKNADELAFAMASAGAGNIGNYSVCTFRTKGVGTFLGGKGSNPKAGKKGRFEMVDEVRLEMVCDSSNLDKAIDKIYQVHPFEEPAYEVYDITVRTGKDDNNVYVVMLKEKLSVKNILKRINSEIDSNALPGDLKKLKIKQAVIDNSEGKSYSPHRLKNTLYIRNNKKNTNIEVI